jgi:ERF superfamily
VSINLRDKARAAATRAEGPETHSPAAAEPTQTAATQVGGEELPDIEYTATPAEVAQVPVHVAWARVMADVQTIVKGDRRDDVGGKYKFRGVDRVVNAVGPALRRHGVLVQPARVFDVVYREARTSKGTLMEDCTLKVEWAVIGPEGDTLPVPLQSAGQANDTGDKATAKAMSVAQRVLFLTALHVPTGDPDIDKGHDRGERPLPAPNDYRDEIVDPATSLGRLKTIRAELLRHGFGAVEVVNEVGDEEGLVPMIDRIGLARRERSGGEA